MTAPRLEIASSESLPAEADAVVIGAGIVGSFAAYYLARAGLKVVLVEKGRVGAEQSSRNWGWCRQQNRDARELPISTQSLALWEEFQRETGEDAGFSRCGLTYLSDDPAEIEGWAAWVRFARTLGVDSRTLSAAEATDRGRATGKAWKGGVFAPTDGTADPSRAAPVVARAAMRAGACVLQDCAARGLEVAAGRLAGVVTEHGTIRTPIAVMAGGAWASAFCRQSGLAFPQASIRSSILAVGPGAEGLPAALHTRQVSATRRADGGHTLAISGLGRVDPTLQMLRYGRDFLPMFARRWRSLAPGGLQGVASGHEGLGRWPLDRPTPMERMRILDPRPDRGTIAETLRRAGAVLPALKTAKVTAAWAGYIDSTPDGVPAMGEVAALPGLVLAAGFSGHGFGIGPGAGRLIADLVLGRVPLVDPHPYRPDRFHGGQRLEVAKF